MSERLRHQQRSERFIIAAHQDPHLGAKIGGVFFGKWPMALALKRPQHQKTAKTGGGKLMWNGNLGDLMEGALKMDGLDMIYPL